MEKTVLLFGVTGMTGHHILTQLLNLSSSISPSSSSSSSSSSSVNNNNYRIICYVRNPYKIDNYDIVKSRVEIYQGDFNDDASVSSCIMSSKPDFIFITCSLGYTNNTNKYLNKYLITSIMNTLSTIQQQQQQQQPQLQQLSDQQQQYDSGLSNVSTGRDNTTCCHVIYLSGCGAPNPPIKEPFVFTFPMWLASIKGKVNDNIAVHNFLYTLPNKDLNYTVVKMGRVSDNSEMNSNGSKIIGKICTDDMIYDLRTALTTPAVKFCDVAAFLISLIQKENEGLLASYNKKYLWMEYTK